MHHWRQFPSGMLASFAAVILPAPALAAAAPVAPPPAPTYADVAALADSAPLVVRAKVTGMVRVKDARAPGLKPGTGRFYMEGKTQALLAGSTVLGDSLAWLVDLPLDAKGRAPRLKKQDVLLFARPVPGKPAELQLINPQAQQIWSQPLEARTRAVLTELVAPGAPAKITGVRELIYVPGTLAGQGETQIFLTTANQSAASITVHHEPGQPATWGASFSELTADLSSPPKPDTLEWYRLACALPNTPPASANVSGDVGDRRQALADYRTVLGELGPCEHALG